MKHCPECRRDYTDETLNFCLDDGTPLVEGSALSEAGAVATGIHSDEPATALLHTTAAPGDAPTRPHVRTDSQPEHSNAVAVLPFANLSSSVESEYFSDGLAEELLNVLSKIKGLRVAARTSAFAFKGKQVNVEEIGRALHVSSVLEGSVRMAGQRVRIAVQLVDAGSGYHLWSETYDRTMDDIFAIQDDIAQSVVGELRERLIGKEPDSKARENVALEVAKAVKDRAADPEAHRLMLLGRHLLERTKENDARKAVQYFQQALEIDPDYALCWAQMGRAFFLASGFGWRELDIDFKKADAALQKALALDPELAEAHARLGRIRWHRDADVLAAKQSLDRALALAPENIEVLLGASYMARELGRFDEARDYCNRANTIDPLSPSAWARTGYTNYIAGNLDVAESALVRALELSPERAGLHANLGLVMLMQGRFDDALVAALDEPDGVWRHWSLSIIYYAAGQRAESDIELAKLTKEFGTVAAVQIAGAHSMRGEIDPAFEWLERAIEERDTGRFEVKVSPLMKPLHADPRWALLLNKIGFPD